MGSSFSLKRAVTALVLVAVAGAAIQPAAAAPRRQAELAIDKTVDGEAAITPGQKVTFTNTVSNTGDEAAANVRIEDDYDQAIFPTITILEAILVTQAAEETQQEGVVRETITQRTGIQNDGNLITWEIGELPPGAQVLVSYQATAAEVFKGEQETSTSTATVFTGEAPAATDTLTMEVQAPKLSLSRERTPEDAAQISPGATVHYTLTYRNGGSFVAADVEIVETFDRSVVQEIQSVTANGVVEENTIRWSLGAVEANQSGTVEYEMLLKPVILRPAGGEEGVGQAPVEVSTRGTIQASNAVTNTSEDTFTIETPILSIKRSRRDLNDGAIEPEDALRFTIEVSNAGTVPARSLTVEDIYDSHVVAGISEIEPEGEEIESGVIWTISELAGGETKEFSYEARLVSQVDERLDAKNTSTLRIGEVEVGQSQTTFTLEPPSASPDDKEEPVLTGNVDKLVIGLIGLVALLGFGLIGFIAHDLLTKGNWQPRYFRVVIEGVAVIVVVGAVLILSISSDGIDPQGTVSILSAIIGYILGQTVGEKSPGQDQNRGGNENSGGTNEAGSSEAPTAGEEKG